MNSSILDLTCETLMLICKQLEAFEDKKNFARTHPKLWKAFAELSSKKVQTEIRFESDDEYEYVEHWDFFLEWWASNLTSIDNGGEYVDSGELMEMAAKFCPNLKRIVIEVKNENVKKLEESLPNFKMLEFISMDWFGKSPNNNLIKSLQSLTNLRSLNINWELNEIESKST